MKESQSIVVGSFPYYPSYNPYQSLITGAIESAGLKVVRIPPEKWFPLDKAFATDCDILHLDWPHDWYGGKNAITRFLKRWMYLRALRQKKKLIGNTKLVWTAHNLVAHDSGESDDEHQMIQALINQCDGIMVMSEASRNLLQKIYQLPKNTLVETIYHGHYIDCYPNEITPADARNRLGIPEGDQVFLSVGTIRPYKGHLKLIENFGEIAKPNQRLIIAGISRNKDYLTLIQTKVESQMAKSGCKIDTHLDLVPDQELQVFFNAADICVLPFENVLNSGSLLMAMSFGIPVLAPSVGSIPEVAISDYSYLYDATSEKGLRNGLVKISEMEFSRRDRDQHLAMTKEKYSWTKTGLQLTNWYRQLIARDQN